MASLISFQKINKRFGKTLVLTHIDLEIEKGEIFGLLGPNGAGKTTLLRCLLGLLEVSKGAIFFKGKHLENKDIQKEFGFLPENFLPPQNLKAVEFLKILSGGLKQNSRRVDSLFELVGLDKHKNKYIKMYSRGMIQRLGIATALLKDPEVLVLDEPTLGLDPLGQRQILRLLVALNKEGKTIFFSSHIISQIEKVCTRIGVIHHGKIKFVGSITELIAEHNVSGLEDAFLREVENQ